MKIATFNVNNVNKRLANLAAWLRRARPDVACLQELKATDSEFPIAAIKKAGYDAVWRGEKSWNGVAILGRDCEPVLTCTELPDNAADTQSRYIEAAVKGVLIATLYAPNGNPQPGPKFKYKLAWMKRLLAHAAELYALDAPVVLAGDFNVVPTDADIYPTKSYAKNALVQPEPRALISAPSRSGLGRCDPRYASGCADVHVLGLQAKPLATRCWPSHRSSAAEPESGKTLG
jgi:exodeoxyribonuclease III